MSNTGLEEKVEKMNVEEKGAKRQKGSEKTKGEKKKKEDLSAFPLEVSEFIIIYARLHVCVTPSIGVRAGGARGAAVPPNFGQLSFFGQQEKIWAKPVFKDVSMVI